MQETSVRVNFNLTARQIRFFNLRFSNPRNVGRRSRETVTPRLEATIGIVRLGHSQERSESRRYIIRLNSRVVIGCKVGCGRGRQKGHVARFVLASRYSGTRSSIAGRTKSTKEKGEFEASAR